MAKKLLFLAIGFLGVTLVSTSSFAAKPYYEGNTIRLIVGFSAGGGYDAQARIIARHLGKHIPGHPVIIVENMTGAGSLIAANYVYKIAKPDGFTIGHFAGPLFFGQLFKEPGIEFDALKFDYIGTPSGGGSVVTLTKKSGIASLEKWMASKRPVNLGGTGTGNVPDNTARILREALKLPIRLIGGYKGSAEIRLAMESGELDGWCAAWDTTKMTSKKALETGDLIPVLQVFPRIQPELPKVPLAINLAKTDEARQLIEVGCHTSTRIARPFVLSPNTPNAYVQILSNAVQETGRDKEFLEEWEKASVSFDPMTGEAFKKEVEALFKLDPRFVSKLRDVLYK